MVVRCFHIGNDHGGVALGAELAQALQNWGHPVRSRSGPDDANDRCDYPDIAEDVCLRVLNDPGSFGVLVCGTGQGMMMAANRFPGIRAGLACDIVSAQMMREHNDANLICFGQRVLGSELAKALLQRFVASDFQGGRHTQRVDKLGMVRQSVVNSYDATASPKKD